MHIYQYRIETFAKWDEEAPWTRVDPDLDEIINVISNSKPGADERSQQYIQEQPSIVEGAINVKTEIIFLQELPLEEGTIL